MRICIIVFVLIAAACGAPPPEEEVPAVWTAGDDAPLETGQGERGGAPSAPARDPVQRESAR